MSGTKSPEQNEPDINFGFISELEGGNILNAYIPDAENSQSGVTIGIGFDLGARNPEDLRKMAINPTLIGKLYPYLGKKGELAKSYLNDHPLSLSTAETDALNRGAKSKILQTLIKRFDDVSEIPFFELPSCCQTVIASLEFQYGSVQQRCPKFWQLIISHSWSDAINELRNFGDRYSTRRNKEADYLCQYNLPV